MSRLEDHLRKLSKPNLELPLNQKALRNFLSKKFERRSNPFFNMSMYKILPVGATLIIIVFVISNMLSSSVNAAEEMLDNALQKIETLSPEQLENIKQRMNLQEDDEVISILKNAKSASDLKIVESNKISCDEVKKITEAQLHLSGIKVDGSTNSDSNVKVNMPGIDFSTSGSGVKVDMPGVKVNISDNASGDENEVSKIEISDEAEYSNFFLFDEEEGCKNPMRWDFKGKTPNELVLIDVNHSESVTYLEYTQNGTHMILGFNQELLPLNAIELSSDGMTQAFINSVTSEDDENESDEEDTNAEDKENNEVDSNDFDESSDLNLDTSGIDVDISDEDKDGNADVNLNMPGIEAEVTDNGDGDNADVNLNMPGIDFSTSGDNVDVKMPGIDFSTGGY